MWAVEQATPCGDEPAAAHPPQLLMSLVVSASHPSVGLWLQSAKPELQVKPHVPAVQVAVALLTAGQLAAVVHPVLVGAQPALPQANVELGVVPVGQLQPEGSGLAAGYWTNPPEGVVPPVPNPKFRFPFRLSRRTPVLIAAP
jgi:hypothetical protein